MNTKTYSKTIAKKYGGLKYSELLFSIERLLDLKESEILSSNKITNEKKTEIEVKKVVDNMLTVFPDLKFSKSIYQTCLRIITWARLTEVWQSLEIIPDDCMQQFLAIAETNRTIKIENGKFFVEKMVKNYVYEV